MFLTILRSVDIPLAAMAISFPILLFFKTPDEIDILAIVFGFIVSCCNIFFSFCLLIIIGERITRVMRTNVVNSKKATTLRIFTMLIYIVLIFGTGFLIQGVFTAIGPLLIFADQRDNSVMFSIVLSMIPYPFAPSYLISLIMASNEVPIELWVTTLIGFVTFCFLIIIIYRYTLKSLRKLSSSWVLKSQRFNYTTEEKREVKIRPISPIRAFLRKDLTTTSRELETFMNLTIPILMQFIFTFSYLTTSSSSQNPISFVFFIYWAIALGFSPLISGMLVMGTTNLEDSGSSILASLPINSRDQAKAKLILMLLIQTITVISPIFIFSTNPEFFTLLTLILTTLPIFWIFLLLMFVMKVRFFGKLKSKYVIEQVFPDEKFFKWCKMFGAEYFIYFCLIFLVSFLYFLADLLIMLWVLVNLYLVMLGGLFIVFNKMFP
jgi:predicted permease